MPVGSEAEHVSGAENGAERETNRVERSGERAWQKMMERERSAKREVVERERSGSRGQRDRFERGAAFLSLTLRSHAPVGNIGGSAFRICHL